MIRGTQLNTYLSLLPVSLLLLSKIQHMYSVNSHLIYIYTINNYHLFHFIIVTAITIYFVSWYSTVNHVRPAPSYLNLDRTLRYVQTEEIKQNNSMYMLMLIIILTVYCIFDTRKSLALIFKNFITSVPMQQMINKEPGWCIALSATLKHINRYLFSSVSKNALSVLDA